MGALYDRQLEVWAAGLPQALTARIQDLQAGLDADLLLPPEQQIGPFLRRRIEWMIVQLKRARGDDFTP